MLSGNSLSKQQKRTPPFAALVLIDLDCWEVATGFPILVHVCFPSVLENFQVQTRNVWAVLEVQKTYLFLI